MRLFHFSLPYGGHGARRALAPQVPRTRRAPRTVGGPFLTIAIALPAMACAGAGPPAPAGTPAPTSPAGPAAEPYALPAPGVENRPLSDRNGIDVLHYDLRLDLRALESGRLDGRACLQIDASSVPDTLTLDLAGLEVVAADWGGREVRFAREGALLRLGPRPAGGAAGGPICIRYGGTPRDGLFFGRDGRGDPAVFADNWPNRARWWFPANDHPSDKATVRFEVRVPAGFGVIANGRQVEVREEADGSSSWLWETDTDAPIPTYTMVIGVARFDRRPIGRAACGRAPASASGGCAEVSVWALAGDGDYGADRFRRAADMVEFYASRVGPFPYEKLAHVESSTRFGGMENASAIFYGRGGWEERRMGEGVIAHETAHQWFGDAVTPASWYHLWVSEGFASYFGPLYFEARDGVAAFRERMAGVQRTAMESDVIGQAIVDSSTNDLFRLLNANNYQKGASVLHMLRGRLGDAAFFDGIADYYVTHRHGTAVTDDVRDALERASGQDLEAFFRQWLRSPGYPELDVAWSVDGPDVLLTIRQVQPDGWPTFDLDADIEVVQRDGASFRGPVHIDERVETVRLPGLGVEADSVRFDPDGWLLARANVHREGR